MPSDLQKILSRILSSRVYVQEDEDGAILEIWPRKPGSALLFYPGTMIEPAHYQLFLFALYLNGFNICALHLAGHGRNYKHKPLSFEHLLKQGLSAEKWLHGRGYGAVFVCGHSQGGIYALAHASLSRNLAAAFAIGALFPQMACSIDVTRFGKFARYRNQILAIASFLAKFAPWLPVPLPLYLSGRRIIFGRRKPVFTGNGKSRIAYPAAFLTSLFKARISPKVYCPFWLISAVNDALFTPAIIRNTFAEIEAPQKTLLWLPDGGHLAILNPWLASYTARNCACAALGLNYPLSTG